MLHYLFKIVLFQLNSTTMRNSVVLVEFWKANFFFVRETQGRTNSYKSISDGPSVYIITLTLNFLTFIYVLRILLFICLLSRFFRIRREIIFLCKSICEHYHFVIVQFLVDFFYKLNIPRDHHSLELLLYKGIKLNNLFIHLIMNYSN